MANQPPIRQKESEVEQELKLENKLAVAKWLRSVIDASIYDDAYIAEQLTSNHQRKITTGHFQKKLSSASFGIDLLKEVLDILDLKVVVKDKGK